MVAVIAIFSMMLLMGLSIKKLMASNQRGGRGEYGNRCMDDEPELYIYSLSNLVGLSKGTGAEDFGGKTDVPKNGNIVADA